MEKVLVALRTFARNWLAVMLVAVSALMCVQYVEGAVETVLHGLEAPHSAFAGPADVDHRGYGDGVFDSEDAERGEQAPTPHHHHHADGSQIAASVRSELDVVRPTMLADLAPASSAGAPWTLVHGLDRPPRTLNESQA